MSERAIQLVFPIVLYLLGGLLVGVALYPGMWMAYHAWVWSEGWQIPSRLLGMSLAIGVGYFAYGLSITFVCAMVHRLLGLRLQEGRHGFFSAPSLRWVFASSLYMLVKYTFADFLVCTPWYNVYLNLLGARVGEGVMINSKYIHDHSLLTIGEGTIIGGDAVISCHAAEKGKLVLDPIRIGKKCLIGQKCTLMPGVEVGDGAVVGAQAMVLKGTKIPPGTVWVGIPARQLEKSTAPSPETARES